MNAKKGLWICKILSLMLTVSLMVGTIPVCGIVSFADFEKKLYIQVLESGIVSQDVVCGFSNGIDREYSGKTSVNGVWDTGYIFDSYENENFSFEIGGKTFNADIDNKDSYLIFDIESNEFSFSASPIIYVDSVSPLNVHDVPFSETVSAEALGLPEKVGVVLSDGSSTELALEWNLDDYKETDYDGFDFNAYAKLKLQSFTVKDGVKTTFNYNIHCESAKDPEIKFAPGYSISIKKGQTLKIVPEVTGLVERYIWYKDGNAIKGYDSQNYTVEAASKKDAGVYSVKAVGKNGNKISALTNVKVSVSEEEIFGVTLEAYIGESKIDSYVLSKAEEEPITLKVEGLEDKCSFVYIINGVEFPSTSEEYTFSMDDSVDSYTCSVELVFANTYANKTISLSQQITVKKASQSALSIVLADDIVNNNYNIVYSPGYSFDATVKGGDAGDYSLDVSNAEVASVNKKDSDTWTVKVLKAGSFNIVAKRNGNDDYAEAIATKKITVEKAPVGSFKFAVTEPKTVYNANGNKFENKIDGFENVKYEIIGAADNIATIDDDGIVSILASGIVTVKASIEESDSYYSAEDEYTLTIEKADQHIKFEDLPENAVVDENDAVNIYYGQPFARKAEAVKDEEAADGFGYNSKADITYEIESDGTESIAEVGKDGVLSFEQGKTGSVTVIAKLEGNECYNPAKVFLSTLKEEKVSEQKEVSEPKDEDVCKYTVLVKEYTVENGYILDGDKKNESGWFTSDVTVTPVKDFKISSSNALAENEWLDCISVTEEGKDKTVSFYLRNENTDSAEYGAISVAYSADVSIDKNAPTNLQITYKTEKWYDDVLEGITFGVYNSSIEFVLSASDELSGVDHFEWYFSEGIKDEALPESVNTVSVAENAEGKSISGKYTIGDETEFKNIKGKISFAAVDVAGNETDFSCDYVIADSDKPELSIKVQNGTAVNSSVSNSFPYGTAETGETFFDTYNSEISIKLSIIEKNFIEERALVKVNEEERQIKWETDGDNHFGTIQLKNNGDYDVTLSYADFFVGDKSEPNEAKTYSAEKLFVIDNVNPAISVELSKADSEVDEISYYKNPLTADITVKEEKFRPSDLSFSAAEGKLGISQENAEYLKDSSNWSYDGEKGEWEAQITIAATEGEYEINANYKDLAGNSAETATVEFIVDTTDAAVQISTAETSKRTVKNEYPYAASSAADGGIEIFDKPVELTAIITEQSFYSDKAEVSINGQKQSVDWSSEGNVHKAVVNCPGDGDYTVSVKYTDVYGNEKTASRYIAVDTVPSVININLSEEKNTVDDVKFYNSGVTAAISVKDAKFRPDELDFSTLGSDIGLTNEQKNYLKESNNWTYDEKSGEYKAEISFAATDGKYGFTVNHKDLADNKANQAESSEFIIDTVAPVVSVKLNDTYAKVNEVSYCSGSFTAEITVKEERFNPADLSVSALEGKLGISPENARYLKDLLNWKFNSENGEWKAQITVAANEGEYGIALNYNDYAGNAAEEVTAEYIIDTTAPEIEVEYSSTSFIDSTNAIIESFDEADKQSVVILSKAGKDDVKLDVSVSDVNFCTDTTIIKVKKDDGVYQKSSFDGEWVKSGDKWTNTFTIGKDSAGKYSVIIESADYAGNSSDYESPKIDVNSVEPSISVNFSKTPVNGTEAVYNEDTLELTVKVFDDYFNASRVSASVSSENIKGKALNIEGTIPEFESDDSWSYSAYEECYVTKIVLNSDGRCDFKIEYEASSKDKPSAENKFVIDTGAPVYEISFSKSVKDVVLEGITLSFYKAPVQVTVKAVDDISGTKNIKVYYIKDADATDDVISSFEDSVDNAENKTDFEYTWTIPESELAQLRGHIFAVITDIAGNESLNDISENYGYMSSTKQKIIVDTEAPEIFDETSIDYPEAVSTSADGKYLYYNDTKKFELKVSGGVSGIEKIDWEYNKYSGASAINKDYENGTFLLDAEKNGAKAAEEVKETITLSPYDDAQYKGYIGFTAYDWSGNSQSYIGDKVVVIDTVAPKIVLPDKISKESDLSYGSSSFDLRITVKDDNFVKPGDGIENFSVNIDMMQDIGGIESADKNDFQKEINAYVANPQNWSCSDGESTITINIGKEGIYRFTVTAKDRAENETVVKSGIIVVDMSPPYEIQVHYPEPNSQKEVDGYTYYYYKSAEKFDVEATDSVSGVTQIDWLFTKAEKSSTVNKGTVSGRISFDVSDDKLGQNRTEHGTINLPGGQYCGSLSMTVYDRPDPANTAEYTDKKVIVIDSISPERVVELSPAKQVVDSSMSTVENFDYKSENNGSKLYYDGSATATIKITEANFNKEDVAVTVNDVNYEVSDWTQNGDTWTGTVTLEEEGHYVIKVGYTDRSGNAMKEFVSNEIIVDNTVPTVQVSYSPDKKVSGDKSGTYYAESQKATITIVEHNFRASDVNVTITSKDINGENIPIDDYNSKLKSEGNWSSDGDTHVAVIDYSVNSNYTFDISFIDLSLKEADDYAGDTFTVDTTPPEDITIKYSRGVLDTLIEGISFGFYNAPVIVTVSANDNVSGVRNFVYSYTKSAGASDINSEKLNTNLAVSQNANGKTNASATFVLPADGQFNGNVKVIAVDNSGNASNEYTDKKVIVVDSIAPTSNIQLSSPVSVNNGVKYYNSALTAAVSIEEANFNEKDVTVLLNGNPVNAGSWTKSGDSYTSNVNVSDDGIYKLSIDYTDKSGNTMHSFDSGEFMIDRTKPVVTLRGVASASANKGENIGFTLTVNDTNVISDKFKPVLTAIVRNQDGALETKTIDMGSPSTVESGKSYKYTVNNLEEDGVYTIKCTATDLCGNTTNTIRVADSQNAELSQVIFSVNRNGSTYAMNESTSALLKNYYMKSVDNDIVVSETNVVPVTERTIKVNGKELVQGTDYTVSEHKNENGWYRYDYAIKPSVFTSENDYSIIISSVDESGSVSYSDIKGISLGFAVDATAPQVTVSGLENNGRYQAMKQTVTVLPTDDGGRIDRIDIVITDNSSNILQTISYTEDEIIKILDENDGLLTFDIPENAKSQTVNISCKDKAGNITELTYKNVTVSSNKLQILWASNVFKAAIIGGPIAIAGGIYLLFFLKKKKEQEAA